MAVIRPFRALRPQADRAESVASVPYDVVNTDEARALAEGNPLSFLHVSRPEIDLPPGTDIHSDAVYRKAVENFEKLIADCPMEKESEPSLYLYRLIMGDHEQIGIVACLLDRRIRQQHDSQTRTHAPRQRRRSHASHADVAGANRTSLSNLRTTRRDRRTSLRSDQCGSFV